MPRSASEYAVHLFIDGGHKEEVRFPTVQEFQKWYSGELVPKADSSEFISVPIKNIHPVLNDIKLFHGFMALK